MKEIIVTIEIVTDNELKYTVKQSIDAAQVKEIEEKFNIRTIKIITQMLANQLLEQMEKDNML